MGAASTLPTTGVAVDGPGEGVAEQVVAGLGAALFDQLGEHRVYLPHGGQAGGVGRGRAVQDGPLPGEEGLQPLDRQAHELQEDHGGEGHGEVGDEVAAPPLQDAGDEGPAQAEPVGHQAARDPVFHADHFVAEVRPHAQDVADALVAVDVRAVALGRLQVVVHQPGGAAIDGIHRP